MIADQPTPGPRVDRRSTIRLAVAATALLLATGHTPYEQWVVYRRRVLLIGSSRDDPQGYQLGRQVAEMLARDLPESRSRVSRAPTAGRLASLMATDQMDFAVLPWTDGAALAAGHPPYADLGGVALSGLFGFDSHVLVCLADVPATHAYLISRTLDRAIGPGSGGGFAMAKAGGALTLHPGALEYVAGRPMPEADLQSAEGIETPHHHGD